MPTTISLNMQRYVVGLRPPQAIGDTASSLKKNLRRAGLIVVPILPFLPLLEFYRRPPPPVTGHLPRCPSMIIPGKLLQPESNWKIWSFNSEGWFYRLRNTLMEGIKGKQTEVVEKQAALMPQGEGIPLARTDKTQFESNATLPTLEEHPLWRTLHLECWKISFSPDRPWLMAACWKSVWNRRLKKAGEG